MCEKVFCSLLMQIFQELAEFMIQDWFEKLVWFIIYANRGQPHPCLKERNTDIVGPGSPTYSSILCVCTGNTWTSYKILDVIVCLWLLFQTYGIVMKIEIIDFDLFCFSFCVCVFFGHGHLK